MNGTCRCNKAGVKVRVRDRVKFTAEEIVKFHSRDVVGSDWLESIYNVEYNLARPRFRKRHV